MINKLENTDFEEDFKNQKIKLLEKQVNVLSEAFYDLEKQHQKLIYYKNNLLDIIKTLESNARV